MLRPLRNLVTGIFASIPDPIDYASLRGLPKSFGHEAGECVHTSPEARLPARPERLLRVLFAQGR